jgi:hypothetical protein
MHLSWRSISIGLLLSGLAAQAHSTGIALSHTLVNYRSGVLIQVEGAQTDRGERLPFQVMLRPSSNPRVGSTAEGTGRETGLPEWIEIHWREEENGRVLSYKEWSRLDPAERAARGQEQAALPVKSARLAVRSLVPDSVVAELEQSPRDPATGLPLESLELYFVWTSEGVKVRWAVWQECCTVIREGGESLR